MKDSINELILRAIREQAKDEKVIGGFLTTLLFEEAKHSEGWQYKNLYMNIIEEYSKKWENNED